MGPDDGETARWTAGLPEDGPEFAGRAGVPGGVAADRWIGGPMGLAGAGLPARAEGLDAVSGVRPGAAARCTEGVPVCAALPSAPGPLLRTGRSGPPARGGSGRVGGAGGVVARWTAGVGAAGADGLDAGPEPWAGAADGPLTDSAEG
ncbi:hypothetical protein [Streptomyces sp. NPDC048111]|uniref:hypothetical protein n=1 Tax=Streptomyces sp. NPDC048111 TaxID=3365500 RepID=UPI003723907E